jgi:hypothetical protein
MENEKKFEVPGPTALADKATFTQKRIWKKRVDEYLKRDLKINENFDKLYTLIYGQCTDFMLEKLESLNDYKTIKQGFDAIKLIKAIKSLTYQFEGQRYHSQVLHQAKKRL